MLPVIHIGPAAIQSSILALIAAIWLGATIAEGEAKKRGLRGDEVWNIVSIGALTTLVAARLIYIAQNFSAYASDPLQIFSPAPGTLALGYGAIFGALAAYGYIQRRVIPLAPLLDSIAPGALVALGIISLGQFLSGVWHAHQIALGSFHVGRDAASRATVRRAGRVPRLGRDKKVRAPWVGRVDRRSLVQRGAVDRGCLSRRSHAVAERLSGEPNYRANNSAWRVVGDGKEQMANGE